MTCETCKGDGRGLDSGRWVKCGNCDGTGKQPVDPELERNPNIGMIAEPDPELDSSIVREAE